MTRIAVLADIHGNLPALQAVMADIQQNAPDLVIIDGDVINRGPESTACLEVVRESGWPVIFGNHEEFVLKVRAGERPDAWITDWWLPTRTVAEELTPDDANYLGALPQFYLIDASGLPAIRVVHGSPRFLNEGIGPWLTDDDLLQVVGGVPEPIVIGAHTHRTFERRVNGHWALNCGSVGAPFNGNPAAQYLLMTGQGGQWSAEFRAMPYDREAVYAAWEKTGYMDHSVVGQVFKYEVETATFHLGAYERFCEANNLDKNDMSNFERYRAASADVAPGRSLKHFPHQPY